MRILHAEHLIMNVWINSVDQWEMYVSNNGVVIGHTYGNLPVPSDSEL